MFGNLKNKLGDVAELKKYASPQALSSLTGSRQRSGQHTPGSVTSSLNKHSRQSSITSLQNIGLSPENNKSTIAEEDESKKSSPQLDLNKTQELKVQDLERELEKLRNALENQQDASLQRLNTKDQEWKAAMEKESKKILSLNSDLEKVTQEKFELIEKFQLKSAETESFCAALQEKDDLLKEMEGKIAVLQDNYDQLEGHGTQEVAKIKHLLLSTSSELETTKAKLEEKSHNVSVLQQRIASMSPLDDRVRLLSEEKMELETQVAGFSQKLTSANAKLETQAEDFRDAIKHLEEKVSSLQSRNSNNALEESEKNQALVQEREALEHKLEETRQQLSNIKSSWSDKISSLENQIHNLNSKIAEDQVDMKYCESTIQKLNSSIAQLETKKQSLEEQMIAKEADFEKSKNLLEENIDTQKWQLDSLTEQKDKDLKELRRAMNMKEEQILQLKEDLCQLKEEYSSVDHKNTNLEDQLKQLMEEHNLLQDKNEFLQSSYETMNENLTTERNSVESLSTDYELVKTKLQTLTSEKAKLSSNLDSYLEKVKSFENEQCQSNQENERLKGTVAELENKCLVSNNKCSELTLCVQKLENEFDSKVEQSPLVISLRTKLKTLEDELAEKKQMVKVQSQRLADMKKTFQKEIKRNTDSDSNFESSTLVRTSPRSSVNDQPATLNTEGGSSHTWERQSNGTVIEMDYVNLEYLKHVIFKFLTSREYEAVQLTRAVSTLLRMTPDEEQFLKNTLEYKMSWFGSKPNTGSGQMAKAIPPSQ